MLIPQITDETRRDAHVTATAQGYEVLAAAIKLLEKHEPQEGDFPHDFWISEREHRKRLQALRDARDQCKPLGKSAVFADADEVSV